MNTWHSLGGEVHANGQTGLQNFTITTPSKSFFNVMESIINSNANSEQHKKQMADKNQFLVSDPDGIQIVIKAE
jgi:catechol-2,3-dioxygenase